MSRNNLFLLSCICAALSWAVPATAQIPNNTVKTARYLALGDSLPFGLNPLIQPPDLSKYVGYPLLVSKVLRLNLSNASCPGETSGTFDGTSNVFFPGYNCAPLRASGLFVPYNGAANQLQYAVNYLKSNSNVKLVTLNIGVNDLGILQADCTEQHPGDPTGITFCETTGLPTVLGTYTSNLVTIFGALRGTGYTGPIVFLNANAFNYSDPVQVGAIVALNQFAASASVPFNVTIANGFAAFQIASLPFGGDTCKAGLLIKYPNGTCDTHPSTYGQALFAATIIGTVEALPKY